MNPDQTLYSVLNKAKCVYVAMCVCERDREKGVYVCDKESD
mgnify:CR=1 FL=1